MTTEKERMTESLKKFQESARFNGFTECAMLVAQSETLEEALQRITLRMGTLANYDPETKKHYLHLKGLYGL